MLKFMLYMLIINNLYGSILFIGDSKNSFKCDDDIGHPTSMNECEKVEAITDINICFFKLSALGCKKLFKGELYLAENIDANPLNFKRLFSFQDNNSKTSFGVKRFSNEIKDIGMPFGTILKPKNKIEIKLDKKYNLEILILDDKKKIIFKDKYMNDSISLNSNLIKYSQTYTWLVLMDGVKYEGKFDVIDTDTENEIYSEITNLLKNINESDDKSKTFIQSIILDQYSLNYDRNLILNGVFQYEKNSIK